jgi:3-phosphoglycerate kinase
MPNKGKIIMVMVYFRFRANFRANEIQSLKNTMDIPIDNRGMDIGKDTTKAESGNGERKKVSVELGPIREINTEGEKKHSISENIITVRNSTGASILTPIHGLPSSFTVINVSNC